MRTTSDNVGRCLKGIRLLEIIVEFAIQIMKLANHHSKY